MSARRQAWTKGECLEAIIAAVNDGVSLNQDHICIIAAKKTLRYAGITRPRSTGAIIADKEAKNKK